MHTHYACVECVSICCDSKEDLHVVLKLVVTVVCCSVVFFFIMEKYGLEEETVTAMKKDYYD